MQEKTLNAPVTNRGVDNTEKMVSPYDFKGETNDLQQFIVIDWFQFTILFSNYQFDSKTGELISFQSIDSIVYKYFYLLFHLHKQDIIKEDGGINGYTTTFSYNNIYAYINYSKPELGINFKLSGSGCRDFEDLGMNWYSLFKGLNLLSVNYNRIDIAIDDFTCKYFTLSKLRNCVRKGRVVSKFLTSLELTKRVISDASICGSTLQFGSKASNIQITFYDKLLERQSSNVIITKDIKFWTRCEVRFRHERAKEVVNLLSKDIRLNPLVKSILSDYIRFLDYDSNDTNKSRWNTCKWWSDYLENLDDINLSVISVEHSITKKKAWLDRSVAKSQLLVYLSTLDNLELDDHSSDFIKHLLIDSVDSIKDKDLQLLNDFRFKNKLPLITKHQIEDYVRDIKDVIVLSENKYLD